MFEIERAFKTDESLVHDQRVLKVRESIITGETQFSSFKILGWSQTTIAAFIKTPPTELSTRPLLNLLTLLARLALARMVSRR
jgi:hypothetical protein